MSPSGYQKAARGLIRGNGMEMLEKGPVSHDCHALEGARLSAAGTPAPNSRLSHALLRRPSAETADWAVFRGTAVQSGRFKGEATLLQAADENADDAAPL